MFLARPQAVDRSEMAVFKWALPRNGVAHLVMGWVAQSTGTDGQTDGQNLLLGESGGYAPRDLKVALGGLRRKVAVRSRP